MRTLFDIRTAVVLTLILIMPNLLAHTIAAHEITFMKQEIVELIPYDSDHEFRYDINESSVDKSLRKVLIKTYKQYLKEGWKCFDGDDSLLSQIEKAYVMELELDAKGETRYTRTTTMAADRSLETARIKAVELAKMRLASIVGEEIDVLINLKIENERVGNEVVRSSTELITTAKAHAVQKLGRIEPVIECWREGVDKSFEVRMVIMYDTNEINSIADDSIRINNADE